MILWPRDHRYSHSGAVSFSLSYSGQLRRVAPDPGAYIRLEQRRHGRLLQSLSAQPLSLAPYRGEPGAELPVYAERYVRRLAASLPDFVRMGDGKIRIIGVIAYDVLYRAGGPGQRLYGRDVLLLPDQPGSRSGVVLVQRATAASDVQGPGGVAVSGPIQDAVKSFQFGA